MIKTEEGGKKKVKNSKWNCMGKNIIYRQKL
jgi:hypothetical protein